MLTHPVKVSWAKRNPKKRSSSVTWSFPKTFNEAELAGFERDLRGHYLIARECKLSLLSVSDGRSGQPEYTILPFRHIEALAVTGTVTLTTREFVSPNNKLSNHKYQYADGSPIKAGHLVTTNSHGGTFKVIRGKGDATNRDDPSIKLKATTSRRTMVAKASELTRLD